MERFVCIIPARGGSKGIPKKNIALVGGKPLIAWSIEQAQRSPHLKDRVFVTSDSDEIIEVARKFGATGIKRPQELATDTSSSESAIEHALQEIERSGVSFDAVVFLQATSPLRKRTDIDDALTQFQTPGVDSLFSALPLKDFFLWGKNEGFGFSKNFDYKNRKRRQDIETTWLENGSIYIFRKKRFLAEKNRLGGNISIFEMDRIHSVQIDDHDELKLADFYLREQDGK